MYLNDGANERSVQLPEDIPSADPARVLGATCHLVSACSIIATSDGTARSGIAVTAVCPVTADPPRVLVCIAREAPAHALIIESGTLSINVLSDLQQGLAMRFAGMTEGRRGEDCFLEGEWGAGRLGAPILHGALASFDCRVSEVVPAGTQTIFICDVIGVMTSADCGPLIVFNQAYGTMAVQGEAARSFRARRAHD